LETGDPRQVFWDGTKFIIPINRGGGNALATFVYSYDGQVWYTPGFLAPFDSGQKMWWLAWNGTTYVAANNDGGFSLASSPDGFAWTTRLSAGACSVVEWGGNIFLALVGTGTSAVRTSPDGITWTQRTHSVIQNPQFPTWNGNAWYMTGLNAAGTSNVIAKSVDNGVNWTIVATFAGTNYGGLAARMFSNAPLLPSRTPIDPPATTDEFLIVSGIGSNARRSYVSFNGQDWSSNIGFSGSHKPVWTGSNWISPARKSANGLTWRTTTGSTDTSGCSPVAWNGRVAVFFDNCTGQIRTSADGQTWATQATGSVFTGATVADITWGQDRFLASIVRANSTSHYAYSFDASTWVAGGLIWASNAAAVTPNRILWNGSYWIAGGISRDVCTNLARSTDGYTWSNVGAVTTPVRGLEWNGDIWVASASNAFWTSPDGTTWTSNGVPTGVFTTAGGSDIAWTGSAWYAIGAASNNNNWAVARSLDGSNWALVTTFPDTSGGVVQPYITARQFTAVRPATAPTGSLVVSEVSGTSLTIGSSNVNRSFYLTNSGFNALSLPSSANQYDGGSYWSLRNATNASMSITLTNTLNLTSPLILPSSNTQTLVVSRDTSNTILLL
jgi:hypothetical protein